MKRSKAKLPKSKKVVRKHKVVLTMPDGDIELRPIDSMDDGQQTMPHWGFAENAYVTSVKSNSINAELAKSKALHVDTTIEKLLIILAFIIGLFVGHFV